MSVWADGDWMLGDAGEPAPGERELVRRWQEADDGKLGDLLAEFLAGEPVGLSCDVLARRSNRRRAVVLATLRAESRFEHRGAGRGSRWVVLPAEVPPQGSRDGLGRKDRPGSASELTPAAGDAQNARRHA